MFNVRFGYYLGAICIFPIILWYDGIKNTLFRKNNTRLHILSGMIGILIITLPAIFLIFNLPPTYNRIIKTVTGEVVKRQCIGTGYLNGLAAYSIILDDKDTNKIYNFPDVIGIENELKKGDEIEIYLYEFYGAQSRIITKVNGKELYYVKQDHPFNKTLEKFIGIGILNGHAIYMVYCAYREYIQGGRKKRGKGWCIIGVRPVK